MRFWPLTLVLLGASAFAGAPELNVSSFASCLSQVEPIFSAAMTREKYSIDQSSMETLLPYLAFYPGQRFPIANGLVQKKGFELWGSRFDAESAVLAVSLASLAGTQIVPSQVFSLALKACGGTDVFCAAISAHNVLRTLGRYPQAVAKDHDYNPDWFKDRRDYWLGEIPLIRTSLISLRRDANDDHFGEWYHFFGIFTYALAGQTANGNLNNANQIVKLNQTATFILTGKAESPEKAQVDQDSVDVSKFYINGTSPVAPDCSEPAAYVALSLWI